MFFFFFLNPQKNAILTREEWNSHDTQSVSFQTKHFGPISTNTSIFVHYELHLGDFKAAIYSIWTLFNTLKQVRKLNKLKALGLFHNHFVSNSKQRCFVLDPRPMQTELILITQQVMWSNLTPTELKYVEFLLCIFITEYHYKVNRTIIQLHFQNPTNNLQNWNKRRISSKYLNWAIQIRIV